MSRFSGRRSSRSGGDAIPPPLFNGPRGVIEEVAVPEFSPGSAPGDPPPQQAEPDDIYQELCYVGKDPQTFLTPSAQNNDDDALYLDVMTNEKRSRAIGELLYTEENYINKVLKILDKNFYAACQLQPGVFSSDEIDLVFSNISEIHAVHRQWLRDLKKVSAPKKEEARLISEVFSKFGERLKCYTKFCGLAPSALGTVSGWMKDKRAAAVLMDCKQSSNQKFFLNDLIPVVPQRIQKYPMLLEALHKATPEGHPDKVALLSTMETMREVTMYVDSTKTAMDDVREIEAKIVGMKGKSMVQMGPLQCTVQCGMLSKNRKKIEGVSVFLFEQGVVLCKLNSNDLKKAGKKLQTAAEGSPEHAQLVAGIKVEFEQFYELRQITKVQQLVPASMPDVANLQSNMYGMDTFTSGWRIQLKVDDEMIFVAPRQLQQQFCEIYNTMSDAGIYGGMPTQTRQQQHQINGTSWNWPRTAVTLGSELGSGYYGKVFRGKLSGEIEIAVKTLHPGVAGNQVEFKKEIDTLAAISKVNHPHLLQFYGMVPADADGPIWMLTEYLAHGSLKSYLASYSKRREEKSFAELVDFAAQITSGMAHLEADGFVHRDLAARNVLVGSNKRNFGKEICKIADFGLSRVLNVDGEYMAATELMLPYRWTAPEGMDDQNQTFTSKSDVWAFGVLLAELFMFGDMPYAKCTQVQPFMAQLMTGMRLESPPGLPMTFYRKMLECWDLYPDSRPTFRDLKSWFSGFSPHFAPHSIAALIDLLGYSSTFCQEAMADRGEDIACTADYIFGLASTEFQLEQSVVQLSGRTLEIVQIQGKPGDLKPTLPSPEALAVAEALPEPGNFASAPQPVARPPRPPALPATHTVPSRKPSARRPPPTRKPSIVAPKPAGRPLANLVSMAERPLPKPPKPGKPPAGSSIRQSKPSISARPPFLQPAPGGGSVSRSMSVPAPPPAALRPPAARSTSSDAPSVRGGASRGPTAVVSSDPDVCRWPQRMWLMQDANRDMAYALLSQASALPGDFLMRPSRDPGSYSLSFRTPKIVEHFQILPSQTGGYTMSGTGQPFTSLDAVINHYTTTALLHDTVLQRPVPRT